MMYSLRPLSAIEFATDPDIRFPRFQRKSTWNKPQRFNLALSVFHDYPLGMVVVRNQEDDGASKQHFLLDGRQRRETLEQVRNPEVLWSWAKSCLGLKASDTSADVHLKFLDYLREYFGVEDWEEEVLDEEATGEEGQDESEDELEGEEEGGAETASPPSSAASAGELLADFGAGLAKLLKVIQVAHPVGRSSSNIGKAFDLTGQIEELQYATIPTGGSSPEVSTRQLFVWLRNLPNFARPEGYEWPPSKDVFSELLSRYAGKTTDQGAIDAHLDAHWGTIRGTIDALAVIDDSLRAAKVGYLEINDCAAHDEKKIFEIINSAGTQLTAVEILSAKPAWNIPIAEPTSKLETDTAVLYRDMGIELPPEAPSVVRWDEAATFVDRVDVSPLLGSHDR